MTADGVLIAGAGIGGLTAALALARHGIKVTLLDQAEELAEAGAGIQPSPSATGILVALGLAERLKPSIVQPSAIRHGSARRAETDCNGAALIGADGLWSRLRALLGDSTAPRFASRTAFRAIVSATQLSPQDREPVVNLWIGPDGHLVHYAVRAGTAVNIVAVAGDRWQSAAWSTGAERDELIERFPAPAWAPAARELLAVPERWQKWALCDRIPTTLWGCGPVTLLGDAAHTLPGSGRHDGDRGRRRSGARARPLTRRSQHCPAQLRNHTPAAHSPRAVCGTPPRYSLSSAAAGCFCARRHAAGAWRRAAAHTI